MKKPRGRQPGSSPNITCTDDEWEGIRAGAAEAGMSVSAWAVHCALTVDPSPAASRRVVLDEKQQHPEAHPRYHPLHHGDLRLHHGESDFELSDIKLQHADVVLHVGESMLHVGEPGLELTGVLLRGEMGVDHQALFLGQRLGQRKRHTRFRHVLDEAVRIEGGGVPCAHGAIVAVAVVAVRSRHATCGTQVVGLRLDVCQPPARCPTGGA